MRLSQLGQLPSERAGALPGPEDFDPDLANTARAEEAYIFGDLIGCQEVLAKLREWQATIHASQALGKDPLDSFELNFLFVGSPGMSLIDDKHDPSILHCMQWCATPALQ